MELEERAHKYQTKIDKQIKQQKEFLRTVKMKSEERQFIRDRNFKRRQSLDDKKDDVGIQAMIQFKRGEKAKRDEEIANILKSKLKQQQREAKEKAEREKEEENADLKENSQETQGKRVGNAMFYVTYGDEKKRKRQNNSQMFSRNDLILERIAKPIGLPDDEDRDKLINLMK